MPIRRALASDAAVVAQLIRELAEYEHLGHEVVWDEASLSEALFGDDAVPRVLLTEAGGGEVAGPEHRGAGHGRDLVRALGDLTSGRVEWRVLTWNGAAAGFYEALGARRVEGWDTYRWLPGV